MAECHIYTNPTATPWGNNNKMEKQIRPERVQSIAYGNAIRENIRQTLSPERAQSIGCQAFSLMNRMGTFFAGRCPALLIQGLRPNNIFV